MTDPAVTLRSARPADVPALSSLIGRVLVASNLADYGAANVARVASHFTPDAVVVLMARTTTLVAERGGTILGTASYGPSARDDVPAVRTFFVEAAVQGQGIGTTLLDRIEALARADGIADLPVRSSIAGEPFYAARGYVALRDHWDGDERTIQMRKSLAAG